MMRLIGEEPRTEAEREEGRKNCPAMEMMLDIARENDIAEVAMELANEADTKYNKDLTIEEAVKKIRMVIFTEGNEEGERLA